MDYLYDVAYTAYNDLEDTERDSMVATFNLMCGNIDYDCAIAAHEYSLIMYGIEPSDEGKFSTDMSHEKINHGFM